MCACREFSVSVRVLGMGRWGKYIVISTIIIIHCTWEYSSLTHWGRVTHICVSKLIIIGSDNDVSPSRRQAIIWTNGGMLLIRNLGTNFSEILSEIYTFSFKKIHLKMSSGKWRPFCLGLSVLNTWYGVYGVIFTTDHSKQLGGGAYCLVCRYDETGMINCVMSRQPYWYSNLDWKPTHPGRAWAHRSHPNRSTFCWWYVQRHPIQRYFSWDQASREPAL